MQVFIEEERHRTRADVVPRMPDGTSLRGTGSAPRSSADALVPEIGHELATSRALVDLGHQLLEAAAYAHVGPVVAAPQGA